MNSESWRFIYIIAVLPFQLRADPDVLTQDGGDEYSEYRSLQFRVSDFEVGLMTRCFRTVGADINLLECWSPEVSEDTTPTSSSGLAALSRSRDPCHYPL